jgi:NAD(P)-dependent dehydrogenase (short-subunit alcohol dehydrogenase family)
MGRYAETSEVADTVLYFVSDKASFITGVDGGMFA